MAKDKKGFILYADQKELFDQLPNDKAGELIKHIFAYVNDEDPVNEDLLIKLAFTPIKQQLKRDLKKYENICDRNSKNGSLGGRPKKQEEPKKPTGLLGNPKKPKKPDTDKDTDTDTDKDIIYRSFDHLSLSNEEFSRLEKRWTKKQIDQVLDNIENYDKNKNYKRLDLTAKNWLVKDYPEKPIKLEPIRHWNQNEG